jgi:hypothetical protein
MVLGAQSDPLLRIHKVLSGISPVITFTLANYAIHSAQEKSNDFEEQEKARLSVILARMKL